MKPSILSNRDGSQAILLGNVILKEKPSRKRSRRQEWAFSHEILRLREIEKIIRHRHRNGIPDPAGTDDFEMCFAYVRAVAMTPRCQDVVSWCETWAPWAVYQEALVDLVYEERRRKYMLRSDAVAALLHVTLQERTALGLKTIGACDVSAKDRKALAKEAKRLRDRTRQEQKRRAAGMIARTSQQAPTITELKPWEAAGVSRATWYRRRETDLSRVDIKTNGDTAVSFSQASGNAEHIGQSRAAGLVEGLGDHPPAGLQGAAPHGMCDERISA